MADNRMTEQKTILVIRAPLSEEGYASIHFSSNDGRLMTESEWWHLKQVVELAIKAFGKSDGKAQAATAGS